MGRSLEELSSYMRPVVEELLRLATDAGLDPIIEDTGRTPTEQDEKINLGVSWTKKSLHLPQPPEGKSEAIDIVPKACMKEKYWGWTGEVETSHPHWAKFVELVESVGLQSGVDFPHPDVGHVQWPRDRVKPGFPPVSRA